MTKRKRCIIVGLTVLAAAAAALAVMLTRNRPAFIVKHVIYEAMDANSTVNSRWWAYDINALELLQGGYNKERDFFDGMSKEYGEKITSWKEYYKVSKKSLVQMWEETCGQYSVAVKITEERDISAKTMMSNAGVAERIEELQKSGSFDGNYTDRIEAAKKISAEAKISGEKGLMRKECTAYVVKISGAWKALWIGIF